MATSLLHVGFPDTQSEEKGTLFSIVNSISLATEQGNARCWMLLTATTSTANPKGRGILAKIDPRPSFKLLQFPLDKCSKDRSRAKESEVIGKSKGVASAVSQG